MNFIKNIILLLVILFYPLSAMADNAIVDDFSKNSSIISVNNFEKDFIKNDTQSFNINFVQNRGNSFRKTSKDNLEGYSGEYLITFDNENNFNLSCANFELKSINKFQNPAYFLLFQIQPNAP